MSYQRKKRIVSSPEEEKNSTTGSNTGWSNSDRIKSVNSTNVGTPKTLWGTMTLIVNGSLQQAKQEAHALANNGRDANDQTTTNLAGNLWTLAHHFQEIQHHISTSNFTVAHTKSASAAQLIQQVIGEEAALTVLGDKLIAATRGYTLKAKQGIQAASNTQETTTESTADPVIIEQPKEEIPVEDTQKSSQTGQLNALFVLIANGHLSQVRTQAHALANTAREKNEMNTAEILGTIWTISQTFTDIQTLLKAQEYAPVKNKAKNSADKTRTLIASGHISNEVGERVLKIAGGYWTIANKMIIEQSPSRSTQSGTAAAKAQNAATIDQHRLNHPNNGAYCGVATLMMLFEANGQDANNTQEMNRIASQIYISGRGSDVGLMGQLMRKRGYDSAQATRTGGMKALLDTLDKGQPVPFGVSHSKGVIIKLNAGGSERYPGARVGDYHSRSFGIAGHWVLVTGYEGSRENPTHFIVNDPDLGGQLRVTKTKLTRMGVGEGQFYQVTQ